MASHTGSSLASTLRPYLRVSRLFAGFGTGPHSEPADSDTLCDMLCLIGRNGGSMRVKDAMAAMPLTKSEFLDLMEDGIRRSLLRERSGPAGVELQLTCRGQELA